MGLSNKIATKMRTMAKEIPVRLPADWDVDGFPLVDAVIRDAVSTIARIPSTSSGYRGYDFYGIRSARVAAASIVWVEYRGDRTWQISLGQGTTAGRAFDWQLDIAIESRPTGAVVRLTTPTVLTNDGTLVNKKSYGELRELIAAGLTDAGQSHGDAESVVSQNSFIFCVGTPESARKVTQTTWQTTIRTQLDEGQIRALLRYLPFRSESPPADASYRWQLGDVEGGAAPVADLTIRPEHTGCTARLCYQLRPAGRVVADTLLAERAAALPDALYDVIKSYDADATREDIDLTAGEE